MPDNKKLTKEEFYKKYYPIVKDSVKGTGLFPETVIAQMAIESGWGGSGLSTKHNNFFGIKGGKDRGVSMSTEEEVNGKRKIINDNFRVYNSVEDSIKDYVSLLKNNDKYAKVFKAKTPEEQAELIGQTPYSTSSNYGNSIKQTVMANKDKTKNTNNKKDKLLEEYKKLQDKLELEKYRYEQGKGVFTTKENNELYKKVSEAEKKLNDLKMKMVSEYQSKEETKYNEAEKILNQKIKEFESSGNYKEAKKFELSKTILKKRKDEFDKNKVDFTASTNKHISKEELNKRPGAFTEGEDYSVPNIDLHKLDKVFNNIFKEKINKEPEKEEEEKKIYDLDYTQNNNYNSGGSGSSSSKTVTSEPNVVINDLKIDNTKEASVNDYALELKKSEERLGELQKEEQELLDLEPYNFQPSENYQNDDDLLGNVLDSARGVMGMFGANKEVPIYRRGEMFSEAVGDAYDRREQGLTPEELAYRERQGEEVYAYDNKNIARASGGSAGVYLGNMGSAANRLYQNKALTASQDEQLRRLNRQNFQSMALQDEQVNRQIFNDELEQTMLTKQSGAALVQDAFTNIRERGDFNRQYGKNSFYAKMMNAQINDTNESIYSRNLANRNRTKSILFQNRTEQEELRKKLENLQVLDASFNNDREKKYEEDEIDFFNNLDLDSYRL